MHPSPKVVHVPNDRHPYGSELPTKYAPDEEGNFAGQTGYGSILSRSISFSSLSSPIESFDIRNAGLDTLRPLSRQTSSPGETHEKQRRQRRSTSIKY